MIATAHTLYACVLKLHPTTPALIPATQGHHAHAAFFDIVRAIDPTLAEALHQSGERKPFTISPLILPTPARSRRETATGSRPALPPRRTAAGSEVWVHPDQTGELRFTILHEELFQTFIRRFLLGDDRPTIRLGGADFLVSEVLTTPGSHPWAGYTTAQQLYDRWRSTPLAAKNNPGHYFHIQFASPTAWSLGGKWGKRMEVLPSPRAFFGGLAATWNTWFADILSLDTRLIRDYAAEAVVVSQIEQLTTHVYQYQRYLQVGVTGNLTYELLDYANESLAMALNLLADFAFYAGCGYKTTMGMGQVRRV